MSRPPLRATLEFLHNLPYVARVKILGIFQWMHDNPMFFLFVVTLALIPALFWLWLYVRKVYMDKAHRRLMLTTFILGMGSVIPVLFVEYVANNLFHVSLRGLFSDFPVERLATFAYFLLAVGMIEEYSKHVVVKEVDFQRKTFNRIVDGIEFSVAAALGFAFIENILYFEQAYSTLVESHVAHGTWQFAGVVIMRSVTSMLAHALFSGIFGYYYGRAKFVDNTPHADRTHHLHAPIFMGMRLHAQRIKHTIFGTHVLTHVSRMIHREELIGEGLLIAMTLHAIFNYLIEIGKVPLIVPLIFLEFMFIWHELEVESNLAVRSVMPDP